MMNKIFIGLLLCPAVYLHGAEPADSTLRLMEEITVAANRQQDVKMNVPQQVYILSRAQIERANAPTAADHRRFADCAEKPTGWWKPDDTRF